MIHELKIENLGIIENTTLQCEAGLNVITGESGSGKSLLINSLLFLLGFKTGNISVGDFGGSGIVEGFFLIGKEKQDRIKELGYEIDDGDELVIQRILTTSGKVRSYINGKTFTSTAIHDIGEVIAEVYVQNKIQRFIDKNNHLNILDCYAGRQHLDELAEFSRDFVELCQLESQIKELRETAEKLAKEKDYLKFQYEEISSAGLRADEEEECLQKRKQLVDIDKINQMIDDINLAIGKTEDNGAFDLIYTVLDRLNKLSEINPAYKRVSNLVDQSVIHLEEAYNELSTIIPDRENVAGSLEEIEQRLDLINRLKRKYGAATAGELLQKMQEAEQQIEFLEKSTLDLTELEKEFKIKKSGLLKAARELHKKRLGISKIFQSAVTSELRLLNMPHAVFEVALKESDCCGRDGITDAEFLIKTNKGLNLMPLNKIASGGELSRIVLAVKSMLGSNYSTSSLIFDEIDAGVGGETALYIGKRLKELSVSQQVVCVTHSAQVAAFADRHYAVDKKADKLLTRVAIKELEGEERFIELARMMSGHITKVSLKHAKELFEKNRSVMQKN